MKKYNQKFFDIFLIFVKHQKKDKIIKELEHLKSLKLLKGDMKSLYNAFKPLIVPLGEILNYIIFNRLSNLPKDIQNKMKKLRKNLLESINKNNIPRIDPYHNIKTKKLNYKLK